MDYEFSYGARNHKLSIAYYTGVKNTQEVLEKVKSENQILLLPAPLVSTLWLI